MKIRNQLLFVVLLSILPIIAIVGYANYTVTEKELSSEILDNLDAVAQIQEERVNDVIQINLERLQGITSRTQLRISLEQFNQDNNLADREKIEKIITDAKMSIVDIEDIVIINNKGDGIISTNEKFVGKSFSNEVLFNDGLKQNNLFTDTDENGNPKLFLSGPLTRSENLGVLGIISSPDTLLTITTDYTGLRNTGESFIAKRDSNGDALVITPLRFDSESAFSKVISKENTNMPIIQALLKNEDRFTETVDYRGEVVLSSTRYVEELDWGLVVKIDRAEAFEPLNNILNFTLFSMITVTGVILFSSVFLSSRFSSRISKLSQISKRISQGNFAVTSEIKGNDEIGKLASDINNMTVKLDEYKKNLIKKERLTAIGELSANLAHDLRNPLSVLKNAHALMTMQKKDTMDATEKIQFDMMKRAISRMEHQITNVLDYVKTQSLEFENHDIVEILNLTLSNFEIPRDVKVSIPKSITTISCDSTQMEVLFSNLIQNALHAIEEEGELNIRLENESEHIMIEIEDSGPGIPEESLEKIFEPLYTTKQTGTGLGLASCKNIVESHNGTITVKNNPTTFTILLPKTLYSEIQN